MLINRVSRVVFIGLAAASLCTSASASAAQPSLRISTDIVPLIENMPQVHSAPAGAGDEYQATPLCDHWSAVGARTPKADDALSVYADAEETVFLGRSQQPKGEIEFVAFGPNGCPAVDVYPVVNRKRGAGPYTIEYDSRRDLAKGDSETYQLLQQNVVDVYTSSLAAGETATFSVKPNKRQDLAIYLMTNRGSFVQPRALAVAKSTRGGVGQTETFEYTSAAGGSFGLVVVQLSGHGVYSVSRS